jgi:hypothetical protein
MADCEEPMMVLTIFLILYLLVALLWAYDAGYQAALKYEGRRVKICAYCGALTTVAPFTTCWNCHHELSPHGGVRPPVGDPVEGRDEETGRRVGDTGNVRTKAPRHDN